mgnify:CR=1 FL=1
MTMHIAWARDGIDCNIILQPAAGVGRQLLAMGNASVRPVQNGCIRPVNANADADDPMDVDMTFTLPEPSLEADDWYTEWVVGGDAQSCFNERQGFGQDLPEAARRNNLTDDFLVMGTKWNGGVLEGEDDCADTGDFTVDFVDRGMDSNETDGTDWGEDDGFRKCGDVRFSPDTINSPPAGQWARSHRGS